MNAKLFATDLDQLQTSDMHSAAFGRTALAAHSYPVAIYVKLWSEQKLSLQSRKRKAYETWNFPAEHQEVNQ